ncbi:MAG: hypothetical protein JWO22_660 [Frankiales bacterium]|nr:hypothetical protein [Frankiales bacterium]
MGHARCDRLAGPVPDLAHSADGEPHPEVAELLARAGAAPSIELFAEQVARR